MDYNFPEADDKSKGGELKSDILKPISNIDNQKQQYEIQSHVDQSQSKLIDLTSNENSEKLLHQHHKSDGSGSTDDFEHVYHDESTFGNITKSDASSVKGVATAVTPSGDVDVESSKGTGIADMMEDFLGSTTAENFNKFNSSSSDLMHNLESGFDQNINKTIHFLNAEKKGGFEPDTITTAAKQVAGQYSDLSSYSDAFANPTTNTMNLESDYQKEHYNPSPIKKSLKTEEDEKFISSEDLLGDFKDERMGTPDHKPSSLKSLEPKPESIVSNIQQEQQQQPHSGIEDLLTDKGSRISASVAAIATTTASNIKEDISKIEKSENDEIATKTKSTNVMDDTKQSFVKPNKDKKNIIEQPVSKQMISAEEIFYKFGLDTWFKPESLHPKVESLIYWRDVKKSGIVFGAGLITLLAVSCFSVISVFAYLSLLILAGTIAFRIYKTVMGAVQKTSEGHPFKEYLEMDLNLPHEKVQQIVNVSVAHVNGFVSELRRLFLVEDLVDSIKFGVILWVLTYIGAWFNGMTLVILAFVSLFTLPKVYENNKQSIDMYLDLVRSKILEITDKVKAAVPYGKKPETDKDK